MRSQYKCSSSHTESNTAKRRIIALSYIIFYYGKCSIPKPFAITGAEMDKHFGWPVFEAVEEVNKYFQGRLFAILSGAD